MRLGLARRKLLPSLLGTYVVCCFPLKLTFILQSLYGLKKKKLKIQVAHWETSLWLDQRPMCSRRGEGNFSEANAGHKPVAREPSGGERCRKGGVCKGAWHRWVPKQGELLHPRLGFVGQMVWGRAGRNPGVGAEMAAPGRLRGVMLCPGNTSRRERACTWGRPSAY